MTIDQSRPLKAVAVLIALIGVGGLINPQFGGRLLGGGAVLNLLGVGAVLLGGHAVWRRSQAERTEARLPDVHRRRGTSLAGEDIDNGLADREPWIRDRIQAVVTKLEDQSPGVTDHEAITRFLDASTTRDGVLVRLREWIHDTPMVVRRAEDAIEVLGQHTDVTWNNPDPGPRVDAGSTTMARLDPGETITRPTGRFTGAEALPLIAVGVGILTRSSGLLLVAAATGILLGVVRGQPPPEPSLEIEHRLTDSRPRPGETVRITLAVTNIGKERISDCRVAVGVPPGIPVSAGRSTLGVGLAPGETATTTVEVTASFGTHSFQSVPVIVRNAAGSREMLTRHKVDKTLSCIPSLAAATGATTSQTTAYAGQVDTRTGGAGVEFFGTRTYRRGDALARVDWNRLARTGELTTVQFREERAASVVFLVDARPRSYVGPTRDGSHAVTRSVEAAAVLAAGRLANGDRVGLAGIGGSTCWIPPGTGSSHRARLRDALGTHEAFSAIPPSEGFDAAATVASLQARLPSNTTVVLLSPLIDDWPVSVLRRLRAAGNDGIVVSPDPTGGATPGGRLLRIERSLRLDELRRNGLPVADWSYAESLEKALSRLRRR